MAKYRKKPVVIDAVQWAGSNLAEVGDFVTVAYYVVPDPNGRPHAILIPTLEGEHRADLNDWIIKGVAGEFYPCKPDIFAKTYEPAEEASVGNNPK